MVLLGAPHRVFFATGMVTALVSVIWWLVVYLWPDSSLSGMPLLMWHPWVMAMGVFSPFFYGFLMTTYPRWMDTAPISGRFYIPAAGLQLVGILMIVGGTLVSSVLVTVGLLVHLAGWSWAVAALVHVVRQAEKVALHVWGTLPALILGALIEVALLGVVHETEWGRLWLLARLWILLCMVPVFISVSHRMIPFFSRGVVAGYRFYRPDWAFWVLLACTAGLAAGELADLALLRVGAGILLAATSGWLAVKWQPFRCMKPMLLGSLHVGFAWLPLAGLLMALSPWAAGAWDAGFHALALGYFGSLLIAMVTRVTHGHSGRPLVMPPQVVALFVLLQIAAITRVAASLTGQPIGPATTLALMLFGAVVLLYVVRMLPIYLRPRLDGRAG